MRRVAAFASVLAFISQTPATATFQLGSSGKVMWDSNCNFPSDDYRLASGISEMCGSLCADDAICTHWTWNGYSGGTCWLKKGTPSVKAKSFGASCGYVVSRSATSTSSGLSPSDMSNMLGRINSYRAQNGLNAVMIDLRLVTAAQLHSQDQANNCFMTHTGTAIANFGDRIKAQGDIYNAAAENVAAGQTTVEEVMTSWWNSPGHRANILNKDVVNVGFALATDGACNSYKTYWTQDFGRAAY